MSMIINAPTTKVATYDVANQTDVQFDFDFDPTQFRADGTTLVVEYEGHEIRLENFFDADGGTNVENFLTQDGQAFSAGEFLSAIMGTEGGDTAEEIETAAGAAAGGSGAGDYSDDAGSLFDGLDAVGGQGDAYDQKEPEQLVEVPGATLPGDDGGIIYDPSDIWWYETRTQGEGSYTHVELLTNKGSAGVDPTTDFVSLVGQNRTHETYVGTAGVDTLYLTDDANLTTEITPDGIVPLTAFGDALRLEDDSSFPDDPGQPRIVDIEVIQAGAGNDVVDLSSTTFTYGDVTVHGDAGDDVIWTNAGDDTLYGGTGNDSLVSGTGDDELHGGAGNDVMKGGMGVDLLNGDDGNDVIWGGDDTDTIYGGAGDDTVIASRGWLNEVHLEGGQDTVSVTEQSLTDGEFDSSVRVMDFDTAGDQDILDLGGYNVLDMEAGQNPDGEWYTSLFVGENSSSDNTWIILEGVNPTELDGYSGVVNVANPTDLQDMIDAYHHAVATELA